MNAPGADLQRVAMAAVGRAGLPFPNGSKRWPPPVVSRWFVYSRGAGRRPWVVSSRDALEVGFLATGHLDVDGAFAFPRDRIRLDKPRGRH